METRVDFSPTIGKLAEALAAAQAELIFPAKESVNPHFRSKYAALDSCIDQNRHILSRHGLAVIQPPTGNGAHVEITTILLHKSGEWILSAFSATAVKADPQAVGAGITYLRRYGYLAVLGIAPTDDDDGNAASPPPPAKLADKTYQPVTDSHQRSHPVAAPAPAKQQPSPPQPPVVFDVSNAAAKQWLGYVLIEKKIPKPLWTFVGRLMQGCLPGALDQKIEEANQNYQATLAAESDDRFSNRQN